jgi:NAD(P)-dependent dehydrogenase (short-subunit alcohol dehydrogenase family)
MGTEHPIKVPVVTGGARGIGRAAAEWAAALACADHDLVGQRATRAG